MAVIIEVLGWGGRTRRYQRVAGDAVTIGRDYSNDVVLNDGYVSPRHLRLETEPGSGWRIVDLDSLNGVQVIKNPGGDRQILAPGSELRVGRTRLRLVDEEQQVEPAKPLHRLDRDAAKLGKAPVWIALVLLVFAVQSSQQYLTAMVEWEWKNMLGGLLMAQLAAFLMAAFWALIGRFIRHEAHFFSQLSLILLAELVGIGAAWLLRVIGYNSGSSLFEAWLIPAADWLVFLLLLVCNMALATNIVPRMRWLVATSVTLSLAALMLVQDLRRWGEFSPNPGYDSELEPPALLVAPAQGNAQFIQGLGLLFDRADQMAEEANNKVKQ